MDNTMLIVDDSEMDRDILTMLFENQYMVMEAETGREALDILKACNGNIDIVLLDLMMPDMDGMEVLKNSDRDYFKNVPIVVITANNDVETQVKVFESGASDLVTKPFVPEIVMSRVNNVMSVRNRMNTMEIEAQQYKIKAEADLMTGLYNKTTTEYMAGKILEKESSQLNVLMVLDIDNFKVVNDTEGHLVGDRTIRKVADSISHFFRKNDIVGRIGGDEFVVLMVNVESMDVVREKVQELVSFMKYKPNLNIPSCVSLSIGYAGNGNKATTYADMFKKADEALYQAKQAGKGCARAYGKFVPGDGEEVKNQNILIYTKDRLTYSMFDAICMDTMNIVKAQTILQVKEIEQDQADKVCAAYIDVSDELSDAAHIWSALNELDWLKDIKKVAICKEGELMQMQQAITIGGVVDVLTVPMDKEAVKRCIQRIC